MAFGKWNIDVSVGAMPQKVVTAMGKLNEMLGVEYEGIAYLGSQVVNGTNHAVLAEQIVLTGRDTKNIVVIVFNEKPGDMELTLVGIDRVYESGAQMGGAVVDAKTVIPEDALAVWNDAFDGFVGSKVEPFALLGTQLVNGMNYVYAATMTPVTLDAETWVVLVTINSKTESVKFVDIMESRQKGSLGYSFTW